MEDIYGLLEDMRYCPESKHVLEKISRICQDDTLSDSEKDFFIHDILDRGTEDYA